MNSMAIHFLIVYCIQESGHGSEGLRNRTISSPSKSLRPYNVGHASNRPITEVQQRRFRLVLGTHLGIPGAVDVPGLYLSGQCRGRVLAIAQLKQLIMQFMEQLQRYSPAATATGTESSSTSG